MESASLTRKHQTPTRSWQLQKGSLWKGRIDVLTVPYEVACSSQNERQKCGMSILSRCDQRDPLALGFKTETTPRIGRKIAGGELQELEDQLGGTKREKRAGVLSDFQRTAPARTTSRQTRFDKHLHSKLKSFKLALSTNFLTSILKTIMGALTSALGKIFNFDDSRERRTIMVGLDGAGKTTLLYKMKLGDVVASIPTIGFNVERLKYRSLEFTVWDIGGQDRIRKVRLPNSSTDD